MGVSLRFTTDDTFRPDLPLLPHLSQSQWIYLGLVGMIVVLHGLKELLPLQINPGQATTWLMITVTAILGEVGLLLAPRMGFPAMWDTAITKWQRLWMPLLIGVVLGTIMVIFDLFQPMGTELQTRFPDSLLIFSLGGLLEEIQIHLFLLPLLIWLISGVLLRGKGQTATFWAIALLGAIGYWGLQMVGLASMFPETFSMALAAQLFVIIVGSIIGGALFFRHSGFLAAVAFRYGFYLIWHILWAGGIGLVRYWM